MNQLLLIPGARTPVFCLLLPRLLNTDPDGFYFMVWNSSCSSSTHLVKLTGLPQFVAECWSTWLLLQASEFFLVQARWFWSNFKRLIDNKHRADLKNNSQSTTHIDPKPGTGGKLRVLRHMPLAKTCPCDQVTSCRAGKVRHLLAVCRKRAHTHDWNLYGVSTKTVKR